MSDSSERFSIPLLQFQYPGEEIESYVAPTKNDNMPRVALVKYVSQAEGLHGPSIVFCPLSNNIQHSYAFQIDSDQLVALAKAILQEFGTPFEDRVLTELKEIRGLLENK